VLNETIVFLGEVSTMTNPNEAILSSSMDMLQDNSELQIGAANFNSKYKGSVSKNFTADELKITNNEKIIFDDILSHLLNDISKQIKIDIQNKPIGEPKT
jgi:hypothetical protein